VLEACADKYGSTLEGSVDLPRAPFPQGSSCAPAEHHHRQWPSLLPPSDSSSMSGFWWAVNGVSKTTTWASCQPAAQRLTSCADAPPVPLSGGRGAKQSTSGESGSACGSTNPSANGRSAAVVFDAIGPPGQGHPNWLLVDTAAGCRPSYKLDGRNGQGAAHHRPAGAFGGVESLCLMAARVRMACAGDGLRERRRPHRRGAHKLDRRPARVPWRWPRDRSPIALLAPASMGMILRPVQQLRIVEGAAGDLSHQVKQQPQGPQINLANLRGPKG